LYLHRNVKPVVDCLFYRPGLQAIADHVDFGPEISEAVHDLGSRLEAQRKNNGICRDLEPLPRLVDDNDPGVGDLLQLRLRKKANAVLLHDVDETPWPACY